MGNFIHTCTDEEIGKYLIHHENCHLYSDQVHLVGACADMIVICELQRIVMMII